jgi:hypothetical protein
MEQEPSQARSIQTHFYRTLNERKITELLIDSLGENIKLVSSGWMVGKPELMVNTPSRSDAIDGGEHAGGRGVAFGPHGIIGRTLASHPRRTGDEINS